MCIRDSFPDKVLSLAYPTYVQVNFDIELVMAAISQQGRESAGHVQTQRCLIKDALPHGHELALISLIIEVAGSFSLSVYNNGADKANMFLSWLGIGADNQTIVHLRLVGHILQNIGKHLSKRHGAFGGTDELFSYHTTTSFVSPYVQPAPSLAGQIPPDLASRRAFGDQWQRSPRQRLYTP